MTTPTSTTPSASSSLPRETATTASETTLFRYEPTSSAFARHLRNCRATFLEIASSEPLYDPICRFLAEKAPKEVSSYRVEFNRQLPGQRFQPHLEEEEEEEKNRRNALKLLAGLGTHEISWTYYAGGRRRRNNNSTKKKSDDEKGNAGKDKEDSKKKKEEEEEEQKDDGEEERAEKVKVKVVHQAIGDPVKWRQYPDLKATLIVFIEEPHREQLLKSFCQDAYNFGYDAGEGRYSILSWEADSLFWNMLATKKIRPLKSVILPEKVKDMVVKDLSDFCSRETARWYFDHGVPYKRCVLFYGPPGTGKSSLITALAGHLKRSVCLLQVAHPSVTDDNLQMAIQRAPPSSLIVFEDIDALFDKSRKSEISDVSPLTFSGLLNALDGVCNPEAQIFIMTTNYIDRLDPALIRSGRVDVKIPFPAATAKQAELLFLHFNPKKEELAKQFATAVFERFPSKFQGDKELAGKNTSEIVDSAVLGGWTDSHRLSVSMASLQSHFISCRRLSAEETVARVRSKETFDPDNAEEELERRLKEEEEKKKREEEERAKRKERRGRSRGRGGFGRGGYRSRSSSRSPSPLGRVFFHRLVQHDMDY